MKSKVLFVVEGKDEARILADNRHGFLRLFDFDYEIVVFCNPIYELYQDYKNGVYDDLVSYLRYEKGLKIDDNLLSSEAFSAVYLIFDFDSHYQKYSDMEIRDILNTFADETRLGKIYINYPMMQSYRHLKRFPDQDFTTRTASPIGYKELVSNQSELGDLSKYGYDTYIKIAIQHLIKVWYIITGENKIPTKEEYLSINWNTVYDKEMDLYYQYKNFFVLNTLFL